MFHAGDVIASKNGSLKSGGGQVLSGIHHINGIATQVGKRLQTEFLKPGGRRNPGGS